MTTSVYRCRDCNVLLEEIEPKTTSAAPTLYWCGECYEMFRLRTFSSEATEADDSPRDRRVWYSSEDED